MSDQWQYFPCSMGDDQAFIFLDEGVHKNISEAPDLLARVRLTYKDPHPNGLPKNSEFESASKIEDSILEFSETNNDWYVGRVTVAGYRYFYIYTNTVEASWDEFIANLSEETGYLLEVSFRDDPDHSGYWEDLYPTDDDWQVISDLKVIEHMEKKGDDGSKERKIDHWIYFENEDDAKPFIGWAVNDRFCFEPEHSHIADNGQYCIRLSHNGTIKLNDITSHTIALRRNASEYNGEYDGWETILIND